MNKKNLRRISLLVTAQTAGNLQRLASEPYWLATGWATNSSPYSVAYYAYGIYTGGEK